MKKFLFKSAILALAAPLMLASCSSDSNEPDTPVIEPDFQGIMLSVPFSGTRSNATSDEYAVKELRVIVYDTEATYDYPYYNVKLTDASFVGGINNSTYKSVPIALGQGKYKMYLIANETAATASITLSGQTSEGPTESNLLAAKFTGLTTVFESELTGESRKYLPMGCAHSELKKSDAANAATWGSDAIEINTTNKVTSVYADLTFAVAKVECTITNAALAGLNINSLTMSPYSAATGIVAGLTGNSASDSNIKTSTTDLLSSGKFFVVTTSTGENNKEVVTVTDTEITGTPSTLWCWTGTWYVGENIYPSGKSADEVTKLNFNFGDGSAYNKTRVLGGSITESTTEGSEEVTSTVSGNGVLRGHAYKVTGTLMKNTLDLQVAVTDWKYNKDVIDLDEY